jgi:hypothetical protein
MFRLAVICCVLLQGWLSAAAAPMAGACDECTAVGAASPARERPCCPCCDGDAQCCCQAGPEQTPANQRPESRGTGLLKQVGLGTVPPASTPWPTAAITAPRHVESGVCAIPTAHLARVIATTHLLV